MVALHPAGKIIVIMAPNLGHHPVAELDGLMLFGFVSAFFTLAFYLVRQEARSTMVGFGVCLAATAIYGILQGAWPLGAIQAVWSATTFWHSFDARYSRMPNRRRAQLMRVAPDRITRMFGPR
jgi:hypothetical protein